MEVEKTEDEGKGGGRDGGGLSLRQMVRGARRILLPL